MRKIILALVYLSISALCGAEIITVDNDAPADFNNIQAAIDSANNGDIVIISPGTYSGNGNRDIDFKGKAITVRSTEPNNPNIVAATIIDCNGDWFDEHRGFVFHSNEDSNSVISGLSIINGYSVPFETQIDGVQAIFNEGGAVFCCQSSPIIKKCLFTNNRALRGGAIGCEVDANVTIIGCEISNNIALLDFGNGGDGGGIHIHYSTAIIEDCLISNNQAYAAGGGIYNIGIDVNSLILKRCKIINNYANITASASGGGIMCYGSINIIGCLIADNTSKSSGGGLRLINEISSISECTIAGNRSQHDIGGGLCFSGDMSISNSIFWDNLAPDGKDIGIYSGSGGGLPGQGHISTFKVSYSDIKNGQSGIYIIGDSNWLALDWGIGNIDTDPCFGNLLNGDFQLCSSAGRYDSNIYKKSDLNGDEIVNLYDFAIFADFWNLADSNLPADLDYDGQVGIADLDIFAEKFLTRGNSGGWVYDTVTSPCIDAGNPGSPVGSEPLPNGNRINMGAYGGTATASKSPANWRSIADLNNDDNVDRLDLAAFASFWLDSDFELLADMNRDGVVDFADFAILAQDWLWQKNI